MSQPRPQTFPGPGGPQRAAGQADPPPGGPRGPGARGPHGPYRAPGPRDVYEPRDPHGHFEPPEPRGPGEHAEPREPPGPGEHAEPREPRGSREHAEPREPGGPRGPRTPENGRAAAVRLTGRGAILALLVLSFLGLIVSDGLGWGVFADGMFVVACIVIACYTKPGDLLAVTVCPPLAFFVACVGEKLITSAGGTSAAEGTLVTLATSAPWLFLGTGVTILIGLRRGLLDNIRELRRGLRGDPDGPWPARGRTARSGPGGPLAPGAGGRAWRR